MRRQAGWVLYESLLALLLLAMILVPLQQFQAQSVRALQQVHFRQWVIQQTVNLANRLKLAQAHERPTLLDQGKQLILARCHAPCAASVSLSDNHSHFDDLQLFELTVSWANPIAEQYQLMLVIA